MPLPPEAQFEQDILFTLDVHASARASGALRATLFLPASAKDKGSGLKEDVEHMCRSIVGALDGGASERPMLALSVPCWRERRSSRRRFRARQAYRCVQMVAAACLVLPVASHMLEWAFSPIHTSLL
jgi:hypothetical protein